MKTLSLNGEKKRKVLDEEPRKKKKKVIEPEPVKKKKKKVSTDLVPVKKKKRVDDVDLKVSKKTDVAARSISRLDAQARNSILGEDAENIQQMLEIGQNEGAMALIQKRLLQSLVDLLPHAENNVRETKGQRGVYQINSLITSVREILSDLQATKDRGAIGASLVEKIVRPAFLDIGMALVQEEQRFATEIRDLVTPELYKELRKAHKECVARIGHIMNQKYEETKNGTVAFLQT